MMVSQGAPPLIMREGKTEKESQKRQSVRTEKQIGAHGRQEKRGGEEANAKPMCNSPLIKVSWQIFVSQAPDSRVKPITS